MKKQKYIYEIEKHASKYLTADDMNICREFGFVNILCYHISSYSKYPFIQFLLDKTPRDISHILSEEFIIPTIIVTQQSHQIEFIAFQKIKHKLQNLGCSVEELTIDDTFVGSVEINGTFFLLFNVTSVSLNTPKLTSNSLSWFVLPSEIINTGTVCNIPIHMNVKNLFLSLPQLGILYHKDENNSFIQYLLPDAVYFASEIRKIEMQSVVGILKMPKYSLNTPYYYFCKTFNLAKKNAFRGKDKKIGIMRCALFSDIPGYYSEENNKLTLTDQEICIDYLHCNVVYVDYVAIKNEMSCEDILVLEECFQPLSFHEE
jgi:hypothetical protein